MFGAEARLRIWMQGCWKGKVARLVVASAGTSGVPAGVWIFMPPLPGFPIDGGGFARELTITVS